MSIIDFFDPNAFSKTEMTHAAVIGIFCYVGVTLARLLDLASALMRDKRFDEKQARIIVSEGKLEGDPKKLAKKFGNGATSKGYTSFVFRLVLYYIFVAAAGVVDGIFLLFDAWTYIHMHELPYVTAFVTLLIVYTEFVSIWENSPKNVTQSMEKSMRRFVKGANAIRNKDVEEVRELFVERVKREEGDNTHS